VDFDATGQLLIIYSIWQILEKQNTKKQCISYFIDFREACVSVRRDVLLKILIQFVTLMKPVRQMKRV